MSHVKDVEDRWNTPKGCNAMYVEYVKDVKDTSNTPKVLFFLSVLCR